MNNPFSISDDKLKILLKSYSEWIKNAPKEEDKNYAKVQKQLTQYLKETFLNKKYLGEIPKDQLAKEIFTYSRKLEGPAYIKLGIRRISNNTEKIKNNLLYLIDSFDDPIKKASEVLSGKYRISVFFKAFWSPIFQAKYPKILPNWNNKTERFLKIIGIDLKTTKRTIEEKYQLLSNAFVYLTQLDPNQDFYTLNHLMHYGTEVPEGKRIIEELFDKKSLEQDVVTSSPISYWRIIEPLDTHDRAIWPGCKEKKLIAIGYEDKIGTDVRRMKDVMKVGDRVIAYLERGRVGGVGTIMGDYEDYLNTKPKDKDYFEGKYWRRRKIRWDFLPENKEYWQLPAPYSESMPGARQTIFKLTKDQHNVILSKIGLQEGVTSLTSTSFKGFTRRAFELMAQVEKDPSFEAIKLISNEIHEKVVSPMRALFKDIASDFDTRNILNLEKEKDIVSRLYKANPKLGANAFIWGAFHPKGEYRIESMQFFVWINKDHLTYGIYPSTLGSSAKKMLLENLIKYGEKLESYLPGNFYHEFKFYTDYSKDKPRQFFKVKDTQKLVYLLEKYNLNVGELINPETVIEKGVNLVNLIRGDFEKLVPLYVCGISNNPLELLDLYFEPVETERISAPSITKEEILKEIFLEEEKFDQVIDLLENSNKKQIILQGPPGTGKTFIAQRIALFLAQSEDRVETIQFHPSYSYEDFIEGYRPTRDKGFEREEGIFKQFCLKARSDPQNKYVLIIDEINRGNLAKIFGELLYLLEYRKEEVKLTYSKELFSIPENIYIIGTMNTADRSLAIMDYALRRRFYFLNLNCQVKRLANWLKENGCKCDIEDLINRLEELNRKISEEMRSSDFAIGHSYFMRENLNSPVLKNIITFEVKPLLEEYFYDRPEKALELIKILGDYAE